jgi:SAM-dependent methyltransferase
MSNYTWGVKVSYLLSGFFGRMGASAACPGCGAGADPAIDRKYFHALHDCSKCGMLFRFPAENAEGMKAFYQRDYVEPGLTTECPSDDELAALMSGGFTGSDKDFSHQIKALSALGLKSGARILDYGASWGYLTWQLRQAGFDAVGFEISEPRAKAAARLGVEVHSSMASLGGGYDMVYSSHVLEHVPNPAESLLGQLALVRPGGLVVAHTPNGCRGFRERHPGLFHQSWGRVHPVLLTDDFVAHVAGDRPFLTTSDDSPKALSAWNPDTQQKLDTSDHGFFFAIRRLE